MEIVQTKIEEKDPSLDIETEKKKLISSARTMIIMGLIILAPLLLFASPVYMHGSIFDIVLTTVTIPSLPLSLIVCGFVSLRLCRLGKMGLSRAKKLQKLPAYVLAVLLVLLALFVLFSELMTYIS